MLVQKPSPVRPGDVDGPPRLGLASLDGDFWSVCGKSLPCCGTGRLSRHRGHRVVDLGLRDSGVFSKYERPCGPQVPDHLVLAHSTGRRWFTGPFDDAEVVSEHDRALAIRHEYLSHRGGENCPYRVALQPSIRHMDRLTVGSLDIGTPRPGREIDYPRDSAHHRDESSAHPPVISLIEYPASPRSAPSPATATTLCTQQSPYGGFRGQPVPKVAEARRGRAQSEGAGAALAGLSLGTQQSLSGEFHGWPVPKVAEARRGRANCVGWGWCFAAAGWCGWSSERPVAMWLAGVRSGRWRWGGWGW